jgi:hypothetical protein
MYSKKELLFDCGGGNESDFSIDNYTYKITIFILINGIIESLS